MAMSSWAAKVGDKFTSGKFEYVVETTTSASILKYTGSDASVMIPRSVTYNGENLDVLSIAPFAFTGNTTMTSVNFSKAII